MPCLSNVESFLISSDLIASQLLLEIAQRIPLSPQSVSSHLFSTHLMSSKFVSPHLISSHLISSVPFSAQLITTVLISSHVTWAFLISSHLISASLSFSDFTWFHSFSQPFSTFRSSCRLILCVLISSLLFSHLLSSSPICSADLTSCQLVSPHLSSSQRTFKSSHLVSGPKPAPKTDLGAKASKPYAFHREAFTHSKLLHREACTRSSFYTQKLLHRVRGAFIHSKLLHKASFYTKIHKASFYPVRRPAAKDNSITRAAAAPSNLDAAITMRFAMLNTIELRANASEIPAPKPDGSRRQSKKRRYWSTF